MGRFLIPLGVFGLLAVFLFIGLSLKPSEIPSPLLDKAAPAFALPQLHEPDENFTPADLRGQVWLFNVWASWCVSCRDEHPLLLDLARTGEVPIYGLNYKDQRQDAVRWLQQLGNPYIASAYDLEGQVGIDYGVYGVPETYVIDREGVIRHKHIGPITLKVLTDEILPIVRKLKG